jgi:hypothetical protein
MHLTVFIFIHASHIYVITYIYNFLTESNDILFTETSATDKAGVDAAMNNFLGGER